MEVEATNQRFKKKIYENKKNVLFSLYKFRIFLDI